MEVAGVDGLRYEASEVHLGLRRQVTIVTYQSVGALLLYRFFEHA